MSLANEHELAPVTLITPMHWDNAHVLTKLDPVQLSLDVTKYQRIDNSCRGFGTIFENSGRKKICQMFAVVKRARLSW